MPPTSPAPASSAALRSPLLVRALLLGACAAGLVGLSLPGHTTNRVSLVSAPSRAAALVDPSPLHGVQLARPAGRASRSRVVATGKKSPVLHPKVTHTVAQKASGLSGGWMAPNEAPVVSPYGMRWGKLHAGLDFGAGYGAPIHAIGDGVVMGSGYLNEESGYGMITIVRHSNGFYSAYAHQSRSFVHAGQVVHEGDIIGLVGSTGHSTGPHLHFEIRTAMHGNQLNPRPWLRAHGVDV